MVEGKQTDSEKNTNTKKQKKSTLSTVDNDKE